VLTTACVLGLLGGAGCGGGTGSPSSTQTARSSPGATKPTSPPRLVYRTLFSLPAPVQDPAAAALAGDRFVLLGGLDSADASTAGVLVANLRAPLGSGSLPLAQHDAQAATLAGGVYVFGGGQFTQYNHILRFDPATAAVSMAGRLLTPASDVGVTESDGVAYIVGGFDGTNWLDTILAWRPGTAARTVARLPVGLRYAAVTALNGHIVIVGGTTPAGASDAIYRFDPASGHVLRIGRLPQPITHAGAAALGASVFVIGGRGESPEARSDRVWSVDPASGLVHSAGTLPAPLSDAGVLAVGAGIVVAGGRSAAGTRATVGELVPAAR
jgi:hypothetical protein